MSYKAGLDISDSKEVLRKYLGNVLNGDAERVANTMAVAARIPSSTEWSHSIETGRRAALQFLENEVGYVKPCLSVLLIPCAGCLAMLPLPLPVPQYISASLGLALAELPHFGTSDGDVGKEPKGMAPAGDAWFAFV